MSRNPDIAVATAPFSVLTRAFTVACTLLSGLAAAPGTAAAQDVGVITGLVLDQEDLRPVSGALVELAGFANHRTRTDAEGWFRLLNLPAGDVVIRVEGEGYIRLVERVEIAPMEESLIHFHLHRLAAVLEQLLVEVTSSEDRGRGHSEAQISGSGASERTAADLLLTGVPGLMVQQAQGTVGSGVRIRLRGVSSFVLSEEPQIYVDGTRIDAGGQDRAMLTLERIPAADVARIRVLRGPASTALYPNAAAGVILIETMRRE